ncbi:MAG: hypothetical protein AB4290_27115 [Spirulina sp.]
MGFSQDEHPPSFLFLTFFLVLEEKIIARPTTILPVFGKKNLPKPRETLQ